MYGRQLLALTDQLNAASSPAEAAALLDQVLEPTDGLLERLGDFFESASEVAQDAAEDDGIDLAYQLADAAAEIRSLGETLHLATDRLRALAPSPQALPTASPALPPALPQPARGLGH
ncbi:hypothetical protein ACFYVL_09300 [Streptomyces sp. NPDC004111]|uniref:hypothetical protein n=1 Tax=Streptomyces sp. NPDC004111 TaxID=3364690 RepID=UPI003684707A